MNAIGPSGSVDLAMAVTTEDGSFELGPLGGGLAYRMLVRPFRNAWTELSPPGGGELPPVALAGGGARADGVRLVVDLNRGRIAGVVLAPGGKPLADVTVSASPERVPGEALELLGNTPWPTARTDVDGRFVLEVRGAPTYTVEARPARALTARATGVTAGDQTVELRVPAAGAIAGETRGLGDDARVRVAGPSTAGGAPLRPALEHGAFRVEGLAAGTYRITATDGAGVSAAAAAEVRGGTLTRVALLGVPPGSLRARVTRADGTPTADTRCTVLVRADDRDSWLDPELLIGHTDGHGRVDFPRVPAARAWIRCGVDPSVGPGGGADAVIESGRATEVAIELRAYADDADRAP